MKLRWKILIGVTILVVVATLWLTATHYRAKNALEAYKKQIAQGEEFEITKLAPPPAGANNGALNLLSIAVQAGMTNQIPIATMTTSGRARVSWQQEYFRLLKP